MISLALREADCSIVVAEGRSLQPVKLPISFFYNSDFNDVQILFEGRRCGQ